MSQKLASREQLNTGLSGGCCSSCGCGSHQPERVVADHHEHDHGHDAHGHNHSHENLDHTSWWRGLFASREVAATAGLALLAFVVSQAGWRLPAIALYGLAIACGGWELFGAGIRSLRRLSLNMNVLMSAAVLGACALGDWAEAASLVVLYAISERLESLSLSRSRNSISNLMTLAPETVLVQRDGQTTEVAAAEVEIGEHFLVRAGERLALDGIVTEGDSDIDQSPVTGESLPVRKTVGDQVFAGTLNTGQVLEVRATRPASEGTTARIARLVQQAETQSSPRQRTMERFAARYTPVVLAVAVVVAVVQPLVFQTPSHLAIEQALALLVAACPCAFVISGPIASICALTAAARNGVLIRGSAVLEAMSAVRTFAFDKTGTLTRGEPQVSEFRHFGGDTSFALGIAAVLETRSQHPLARAVVKYADAHGANADLPLEDVHEARGHGISGLYNGVRYRIGRESDWDGALTPDVEAAVQAMKNRGHSVALLGTEHKTLAAFGFADTLREEAPHVVEELQRRGLHTIVLSGDNPAAVEQTARAAGAQQWHAALLPEDKLRIIGDLSAQTTTAMVGDGINDAPSLARADIGIAMGAGGSDAAIEAADIALMTDDLRRLPYAFDLSRHARGVILQNIGLALAMKLVFTLGLFLNLWGDFRLIGGVVADMGTTLLVTANGMRLLRFK